jgi:hypothetical protein
VLDSTSCDAVDNILCSPETNTTGSTDVCPRYRARVVLEFEKQIPTGAWVRVNEPGSTEYTTEAERIECPEPTIITDGRRIGSRARTAQNGGGVTVSVSCSKSGSCTPRKSGTCSAQKTGACSCTKNGGCVPKAGPVRSEIELCPAYGGTEFAPCNDWDCGKIPPPYPPHDGYPSKGGGYPPKGDMYPPSKDMKDKY